MRPTTEALKASIYLYKRRLRRLVTHPLVLSFYMPSLLISVAAGLLSPNLPLFVKELGGTYGLVGLVLSAPLLGNLIGDLPGGVLLRRWGHRKSMVLGILLTVTMTVLCFWVKSIGEAFWLRLISGFGTAIYNVARHAFVTEQVSTGNRGRAIAAFGGMFRIGNFVGPMVGGFIGVSFGLRIPFLFYGGIGALAILCIVVATITAPVIVDKKRQTAFRDYKLKDVVNSRIKILVPAGAGQVFAQMIRAGRGAVIPLFAADVIGLHVDEIGWLLGISSFVEMTLFYPAGWIMDHWGRKFSIVPSFLIQAIAMACVPFSSTFWTLLLCVMAIGAGNGLSSGAMMTLGSDLTPDRGRGEFLGVWRLIGDIGGSGGPYLVGAVADAVALPSAALVMALAGLIAASIFGFLLPETLVRGETVEARAPASS